MPLFLLVIPSKAGIQLLLFALDRAEIERKKELDSRLRGNDDTFMLFPESRIPNPESRIPNPESPPSMQPTPAALALRVIRLATTAAGEFLGRQRRFQPIVRYRVDRAGQLRKAVVVLLLG